MMFKNKLYLTDGDEIYRLDNGVCVRLGPVGESKLVKQTLKACKAMTDQEKAEMIGGLFAELLITHDDVIRSWLANPNLELPESIASAMFSALEKDRDT
jgi:hypothetical protein